MYYVDSLNYKYISSFFECYTNKVMATAQTIASKLMEAIKQLDEQLKLTKDMRKNKSELECLLLDLMEDENIGELEMTNGTRILLSNKLILEKKSKGKRKR